MKRNIIKLGLVTLIIIFFALLMPKVTLAASIEKIEITVPEPVIGETLTTDTSKIQITDESSCNFIINTFEWYCDKFDIPTNTYSNNYEKITDLNQPCNDIDNYQLKLEFLFPVDSYNYSSDETIFMNGIKLNKITDYVLGEVEIDAINYQSTIITYNFGHAKPQKEISKIEITSPTPIAGEKLTTDISKFEVKIDGTEILNIVDVKWFTEDSNALNSDIAEVGKKYGVYVGFNIPNKYALSSDIVVTVNGEQINVNNIDEFNYASSGDTEFDYTIVCKLMDVKESTKEEAKEGPIEESKEEITGENATDETKKVETVNKTKNPETGDTITQTFIIFVIAIAGIALTINSIKKQNK